MGDLRGASWAAGVRCWRGCLVWCLVGCVVGCVALEDASLRVEGKGVRGERDGGRHGGMRGGMAGNNGWKQG